METQQETTGPPPASAGGPIEVCGGEPLAPGWLREPAELLARWAAAEEAAFRGPTPAPAVPSHTGLFAPGAFLALLLVRRLCRWYLRGVTPALSRVVRVWAFTDRLEARELVRALVPRRRSATDSSPSPPPVLPSSRDTGSSSPKPVHDPSPGGADPGADRLDYGSPRLDPDRIREWGRRHLERTEPGETRVIPLRRPAPAEVAVPPHVAEMMARLRERKRQQTAHASYVRAERSVGRPATLAEAFAEARRRREGATPRGDGGAGGPAAAADSDPPSGTEGERTKSWVIAD